MALEAKKLPKGEAQALTCLFLFITFKQLSHFQLILELHIVITFMGQPF